MWLKTLPMSGSILISKVTASLPDGGVSLVAMPASVLCVTFLVVSGTSVVVRACYPGAHQAASKAWPFRDGGAPRDGMHCL